MSTSRTDDWTLAQGPGEEGPLFKKPFEDKESWRHEAEKIDPEGLVSLDPKKLRQNQEFPGDIVCPTPVEWLAELARRKLTGHLLMNGDDPRSLQVGFVDVDDNVAVMLSVRSIKEWAPTDPAEKETREKLLSLQGRNSLVEGEDSFRSSASLREGDDFGDDDAFGEDLPEDEVEDLLTWTPEKVRECCGLKSPAEFLADRASWISKLPPEEQARWNGPEKHRRTGRTTELLVQAVTAVLNGKFIKLLAPTDFMTKHLEREAQEMALKCGRPSALSVHLVKGSKPRSNFQLRPNFEGKETETWAEAEKIARAKGKDTTLYQRYILGEDAEGTKREVLLFEDSR